MNNKQPQLVAALERIRDGRIAEDMRDRLSDTEMARIAHDALVGAGIALSPPARRKLTEKEIETIASHHGIPLGLKELAFAQSIQDYIIGPRDAILEASGWVASE